MMISITMKLRYRDRDGEIFVMRYAPAALLVVLSTHDAGSRGHAQDLRLGDRWTRPFRRPLRVRGSEHAADAPMRESIEIRTMAFF